MATQTSPDDSTTDLEADHPDLCLPRVHDSPEEVVQGNYRNYHTKVQNKPFFCPDCNFRCASTRRLAVHRRKHDSATRYSCALCPASFKWKGNLTLHMKRHNDVGLHVCKVCKWKCLTPSDLERHTDTHRKSSDYKCSECDKSFKHKQNLTQHFKFHTGIGLHTCKKCKKAYSSSSLLKKHMDSHSASLQYVCPQCGKKTRSQVVFRYHMRLHSQENVHVCPHCGKLYPHASALSKHLESHSESAQHECSQCGRRYKHQRAMARHIKVAHSGKNTHDCPQCHKKFSSPSTLRYHLDTHATEAQYTCDVCGEKFIRIRALRYHMKLHTGMGVLRCADCDKTFFTPSALESHRGVHSDQEVVCDLCQNSYKNVRSLERHKQEVHQSSGSAHPCSQCNRSYKTRAGLQLHMRLHTGRKLHHCATCAKGFIKPSELIKHQDAHATQAQYKCDTCGKHYRHRYDLQAHMKVHLSTALKCGHCNKVFATKQQLESHVIVHTDDRPHKCHTCHKTFKYEYSLVKHWKRHLYPTSKPNASIKAYSEYEIKNKDERDLDGLKGHEAAVSTSGPSLPPPSCEDRTTRSNHKDKTNYLTKHNRFSNKWSASQPYNSLFCEKCTTSVPVKISKDVCEILHGAGKPIVKIKRLHLGPKLQSQITDTTISSTNSIDDIPVHRFPLETTADLCTESTPVLLPHELETSVSMVPRHEDSRGCDLRCSKKTVAPSPLRTIRVPKSVNTLRASEILQKVSKKDKPIFINRNTRVLRSRGRLVFLHPKHDVCEIPTTSGLSSSSNYDFQDTVPHSKNREIVVQSGSLDSLGHVSGIKACSVDLVPLECSTPSREIVAKRVIRNLHQDSMDTGNDVSDHVVIKDDPDEPPSGGLGRIVEVRSLAPAVSVNTLEEIEIKTEDLDDLVCDLDPKLPTETTPFNIDLKLPMDEPGYCALLRVKQEVHSDLGTCQGQPLHDDVRELPGIIEVPAGYSIIAVVAVNGPKGEGM